MERNAFCRLFENPHYNFPEHLNVGKKGGRKETRERKSSQVWAAVSFGSSVEEVGW